MTEIDEVMSFLEGEDLHDYVRAIRVLLADNEGLRRQVQALERDLHELLGRLEDWCLSPLTSAERAALAALQGTGQERDK